MNYDDPSKEELLKKIQLLEAENNSLKIVCEKEIFNRLKIEETLKDSNEFNASILKTIPFGIEVLDENGNILFQNQVLETLTGGKFTGEKCWKHHRNEKTPCESCPLMNGINIGESNTCKFYRVLKDNIFEISYTGLLYGGQTALLEIFRNITLQKRAEEHSLKLSLAVENSPASIVITNLKGEIEYVNPKFTEVTGYTFEEALGNNPRILKSGNQMDEFYKDMWIAIINGKEWRGEFQNKKKNGEMYWEFASINPIKNSEGVITHFVAVKEDISERKKDELVIQEKNEQLLELNATKDKFFAIIAHDLRNPFNAILGYTELLVQQMDEYDPEKIKSIAVNINKSASQTYKLLENLLEWSIIQRGLLVPSFQKCNVKKIADDCMFHMAEMAMNKNITIINKVGLDIYANCDEQMTRTVFRNLLSNALKFTAGNAEVTINACKNDSLIEIQVADRGLGIPVERIPYLFRIDKNVSTKGTANEKGTGLGLVLCKELIEKQGGKIWVETEQGKGSIFHFTLKAF